MPFRADCVELSDILYYIIAIVLGGRAAMRWLGGKGRTMELQQVIKERFSVRSFSNKPVEEEKIQKILEAAKLCPTAANKQPQVVYVLQSEESIAKINELSPCIYGAKTVFMICYDKDKAWKSPFIEGMDSGYIDTSICCDEMMLTAWDEGLGSCWLLFFNPIETAEAFGLPDNIVPTALLPVGYYADDTEPAPPHSIYRPMEEMVVRL